MRQNEHIEIPNKQIHLYVRAHNATHKNTHTLARERRRRSREWYQKTHTQKKRIKKKYEKKIICNLYMHYRNDWINYTLEAWCSSMSFSDSLFFFSSFFCRADKIDATAVRERRDKCAQKLVILTSYMFTHVATENCDWLTPSCDDSATRV